MTVQQDCSIGIKAETVYGTAVAVDRFYEFTSESFNFEPEFLQGEGLRVGSALARANRRTQGKVAVSGDLEVEATTKGLGLLLAAAFGSTASTLIPSATGAYQQVHSLTNSDPLPSYTIQKGIPLLGGGAIQAHTFSGMVCNTLEITISNNEIVIIKTGWMGRDMATGPASGPTAYQTPSYVSPAGQLLTFVHGSIYAGTGAITAPTATALATAAGSPVANVTDFSLVLDNGLDDGGYNMGGVGKRSRKNALGLRSLTGKLTVEYDSNAMRDAFLAQTPLSILLNLQTTTMVGTSTVPETLQIVLTPVFLEGDIPMANGGDVITQDIEFTVLEGAGSQAKIVYVSTDMAA